MSGRPDVSDFELAREFACLTYKRFTGEDSVIPGDLEKTQYSEAERDARESFRLKVLTQLPIRDGKNAAKIHQRGSGNAVSGFRFSMALESCISNIPGSCGAS